ncbi:MAG: sugar transferase [Acidimicrobiia bacterium]
MAGVTAEPRVREADSSPRTRAHSRPGWEIRYTRLLMLLDLIAAAAGLAAAWIIASESPDRTLWAHPSTLDAALVDAALLGLWLATMWFAGAYDMRYLGTGPDEYKRVGYAAARVLALLAIVALVIPLDLDAGFVALFIGTALLVELVERRVARKGLHRLRAAGRCNRAVLVVGAGREVRELVTYLQQAPYAGLSVVALCVPLGDSIRSGNFPTPIVGDVDDVLGAIAKAHADVVVLADSHTVAGDALRSLAWQLEGSGVQLLVAPAVTEVAGPRISIRPVAGLPLLHVDEPELTGGQRVFKEAFDRITSAVLLIVLAPVIAFVAIAVRCSGPGPVLFRQVRFGRRGSEFVMLKFRTMVDGADERLSSVEHLNETDGALFKIRSDPRVTRVGRFLRRHSLDELPQLWNVFRGQMSIIGPRPLPSEAALHGTAAHRRLLVKPGISGLWQVSGRSELSWEESIRLDLYYVENWSPALDAQILWRTIGAVVRGRGAY